MMKNSLIVLSLIIVFFSCKKDTAISPPALNLPSNTAASSQDTMLPLSVGNYWIYQKSNDDTLENLNLQMEFDSVYVEKDTIIANEHYYKVCHTNLQFLSYFHFVHYSSVQYLRDSADYIVDVNHNTLLDKVHIGDTIVKDIFDPSHIEWGCLVPDNFVNEQFLIGIYSGNWMKYVYNRNYNGLLQYNVCQSYFVKDIGIVKSVYGYSGCLKYCRYTQNLIRYHVN